MAAFTNQATLEYNGLTVSSNIVQGELNEALSISKSVSTPDYARVGDTITYTISLVNSGDTDLTDLTVTDDLGEYTLEDETYYPLDYVDGSILYYVNGEERSATVADTEPTLEITGIEVPAGGNSTIVFETEVNEFAPLGTDDSILNTAVVAGDAITAPISDNAEIETRDAANLDITKSMYPTIVSEGDQLTYTFVLYNSGNTETTDGGLLFISDTFNPTLRDISVLVDGTLWPEENYTYAEETGEFSTARGRLSVPAAEYTRGDDGQIVIQPGITTVTVSGTVGQLNP